MRPDENKKRHIVVCGKGGGGGSTTVDWDDIQNKPNFATVATTGDYDDLSDKPTILTQWFGTQAEYDLIDPKDPNTIYNIEGSDNVQADWNQSDSTADDYIKNKPTIPAAQVNSDWNANSGVAQILNKPTIPAAPVQSDWNEADSGSLAYIANKPTIPAAQVNADWNSNSGVSQILNKPSLATVATSGNYSDLYGRPAIPAAPVQSDWNEADNTSLAYIANKPTIPTVPPMATETLTFTLQGGTVVTLEVYVKPDDSPYFYLENINNISDITFDIVDNIYDPANPFDLDIYSSTDQENWSLIGNTTSGSMTATVPANGRLYIKANTDSWTQTQLYNAVISFVISDPVNVGGNIMSLLYGDDYKGKKAFPSGSENNFSNLFSGCNIVSAEDLILPATTLTDFCYKEMFQNCTSLTTAPELPATTLADGCYQSMFNGCTSLTTAPVLPATTLAYLCYAGMFVGCTSLTTAPALPATTLVNNCYEVMFYGCTNLNSVTTYAQDISASYCLTNWLNSVAPQGDFYNLGGAMYLIDDPSGIPYGWTEHTSL